MRARTVGAAVTAAAAARLSYALLRARPPGSAPESRGQERWNRTNHRGDEITLLEGPALAIGGVAGGLAAAAMPGDGRRRQLALALAGAGAAAFGSYDDLAGNAGSRGFRGHVGALRRGEITTGTVKIAGIGTTALAAALLAGYDHRGGSGRPTPAAALADVVINTGLIAGSANLVNLFDLRPGRAIKVALVAGGLMAPSRRAREASAAPLAAALALLPEDLGERAMLGDAGANALGAMLGVAATGLPRRSRVAALAVVVGLTAASEVVSFSRVIERTGPLQWADMLGRRPAPAPAPAQEAEPTVSAAGGADSAADSAAPAAERAPGDGVAGDGVAADGAAAGGVTVPDPV